MASSWALAPPLVKPRSALMFSKVCETGRVSRRTTPSGNIYASSFVRT